LRKFKLITPEKDLKYLSFLTISENIRINNNFLIHLNKFPSDDFYFLQFYIQFVFEVKGLNNTLQKP